jgi:NAD(P)-dependent dehydrogenase (short-subunit alcohol dehydrogenase family)
MEQGMVSVIITGAASGIGRATALRLAARGVAVLAVDRDAQRLETLETDTVGEVVTAVADVTRERDVRAYVQRARERFGTVDGFFNNAGVAGARQPIVDLTLADWSTTMSINLGASFLGIKHVTPILRRPGGSVVSTSSIAAVKAEVDRADYVVSKAAVIALSKVAAAEHSGEGLRFNCICPGPIDTPMMAEHELWVDPAEAERARRQITGANPMGRYGQPEEVAALVDFLLLGESRYITGTAIPIDGGYLAV